MHLTTLSLSTLLLLLPSVNAKRSYSKTKDAVLLSKVASLTLYGGKETSHRRVSAIPQLECTGGNAKGLYDVDVMRCKNSGAEYDAEDISWTCQASLPPEFKLGTTEVICEGFDSADDPYILKGSCGVEYRLILTELGEQKYSGSKRPKHDGVHATSRDQTTSQKVVDGLWKLVFWGVFLAIIGIFIYRVFIAPQNGRGNPGRPRRPPGGGGGEGGDDGWDDPPPPYTPRPPPSQPRAKTTKTSTPRSSRSNNNSAGNSFLNPNFWTGAAAGGAAGYGAGYFQGNRAAESSRRAEERAREEERRRDQSSWFGGGRTTPNIGRSSAPGPSSPPSTERYEGTGFGGTRRR